MKKKMFNEMEPGEKFLSGCTPCMKLPDGLGFVSLITGAFNFFDVKKDEQFECVTLTEATRRMR